MIGMYIVKNGGKQYWAEPGAILELEKIDGEVGQVIELEAIANTKDGKCDIKSSTIKATITKHYKDAKVIIFKKKRRKHHERKKGHRQQITQVKIAA